MKIEGIKINNQEVAMNSVKIHFSNNNQHRKLIEIAAKIKKVNSPYKISLN